MSQYLTNTKGGAKEPRELNDTKEASDIKFGWGHLRLSVSSRGQEKVEKW